MPAHHCFRAICCNLVGAAAALPMLFNSPASAETIVECGASKGYGYYFEGDLIARSDSGWTEDGLSGGKMTLVRDGDTYDIWYTDAVGSRSATADGGTVILLAAATTRIALLILYPAVSVEFYQFDFASNDGEVVWGQSKFNAPINKAAVYRAKCQREQ